MGMDLIAIAPTTDERAAWHVNWTGWASIGGMLHELGCNTSEIAGTNDGEPIAASTMTEWADSIDEALQAGRIGETADEMHITIDKNDALPDEAQLWVQDFSSFCRNCGGCEQW